MLVAPAYVVRRVPMIHVVTNARNIDFACVRRLNTSAIPACCIIGPDRAILITVGCLDICTIALCTVTRGDVRVMLRSDLTDEVANEVNWSW